MHTTADIIARSQQVIGLSLDEVAQALGTTPGQLREWVRRGAPDEAAEPLNALAALLEHVQATYAEHAPAAVRDELPELEHRCLVDVLVAQGPFAARDAALDCF